MRCADVLDLLSAYVDRQTEAADTAQIDAHLVECKRCQSALRRQQQTRRLLNLAGNDQWAPPDLRLRIAHAARQPAPTRRRTVFAAAAAGSAAALAVALGLMGGQVLLPSTAAVPVARPTIAARHAEVARCRPCETRAATRQLRKQMLAINLEAGERSLLSELIGGAPSIKPAGAAPRNSARTPQKGGEAVRTTTSSNHGVQRISL